MGQATASRSSTTPTAETRFDAILDAAEKVFAASGYEGATLKEIAVGAGVAQGLIHYHFGTKERLFEAMVARRSDAINAMRARLLDALFAAQSPPSLEDVVEALFRPTIEAGLSLANDGGAFSQILVSVANSTDPRDKKLIADHYDPIAHKFIDALMRLEPGLSQADAVWGYMFAIGVGMTMMARTGRPARLSNGICDDGDADAMLTKIVPYICGGIRALAVETGDET